MNVLHTSDWHFGQVLHQQRRDEEHRRFLNWLLGKLAEERIELLLIAGDVFDSGLPPNYALELYYSFLAEVRSKGCQHVVVVGGNHDSPSTLQAPKSILQAIRVSVVGAIDEHHPEHNLIEIKDEQGLTQIMVCAVPYLRDRDVYFPKPMDTDEKRTQGIIDGVSAWYRRLTDLALARRAELGRPDIPIIATGHLFAKGMTKGGGERDLYVGNLGHIPLEAFPPELAYVALGHIHRPQGVLLEGRIRYSGSPVPVSFDEAACPRNVLVFSSTNPSEIRELAVPLFRPMHVVTGDLLEITNTLQQIGLNPGFLAPGQAPSQTPDQLQSQSPDQHANQSPGQSSNSSLNPAGQFNQATPLKPLVMVHYTGTAFLPNLQTQVGELAASLPIQLVTCEDRSQAGGIDAIVPRPPKEMTPEEVFELRLERENLTEDDQQLLRKAFAEILFQVRQGGPL
jgi:exonuclease SbcD